MKVGILTFHHANNFGAVLQAYGLSEAISALGHIAEVLDYRPLAARRFYGGWPMHPLKLFPVVTARLRFRWFRRHYLPLSPKVYWASDDLQRYPPEVDCLVCGSDQVWNIASYRGFDPAFFLAFLDGPHPHRVSYAATFGYARDLGDHRQRIHDLLSRFDHLSVRDAVSQNMVHELIGRTPDHVLDPSFLADYTSITPPRIYGDPYILVYCLQKTDFFTRAVRTLGERLKMALVSIGVPFDGARVIRSAGPLQWLSLMRHAGFVCTNSFHGTCFSVMWQKDFVTLPITRGQSRLEDILQMAGIKDRLVSSEAELEGGLVRPIDHATVSSRIEEARLCSKAFLRGALG